MLAVSALGCDLEKGGRLGTCCENCFFVKPEIKTKLERKILAFIDNISSWKVKFFFSVFVFSKEEKYLNENT